MTHNTVRVRLTLAFYLVVVTIVAISDGRLLEGGVGLAAQAAGFVLVVTAVLARMWTTLFIAGRKEQSLVRDGPYTACRHPLYAASIVAALGIGFTTRSLVLACAVPVAVAVVTGFAARREEAVLARLHGDAWRDYREAVQRFWPRWSRLRLPETVTVPVGIYRKAFLDAASFLVLWFLVLLCDALRTAGGWPALFHLP